MLLQRVAIDRLQPQLIFERDIHDNSCSHEESEHERSGIARTDQSIRTEGTHTLIVLTLWRIQWTFTTEIYPKYE